MKVNAKHVADQKFAEQMRMANATARVIQEKGDCGRQDLIAAGYMPDEVTDEKLHMAKAMAVIELKYAS